MNVVERSIPGLYVLESPVWPDERGYFREWYSRRDLDAGGVTFDIHQANFSLSRRGVVRGLHYSLAPQGQAKLVTCAHGDVVDVIVDVRVGSPTFARVETVHLSAEAGRSVLLPVGVAHGFCVTSEFGALTYLLSSPFDAPYELEIDPFDETLAIAWPLDGDAIVSAKDSGAPSLEARRVAGELPEFAPPTHG